MFADGTYQFQRGHVAIDVLRFVGAEVGLSHVHVLAEAAVERLLLQKDDRVGVANGRFERKRGLVDRHCAYPDFKQLMPPRHVDGWHLSRASVRETLDV